MREGREAEAQLDPVPIARALRPLFPQLRDVGSDLDESGLRQNLVIALVTVAGLLVGVFSFVRQEPTRLLPLVGLALAAVAVALGWVIVVGAILLATAVIAYFMSELM